MILENKEHYLIVDLGENVERMLKENMKRIKTFFYLVNFYFLSMNFFYLVIDLGGGGREW